MAIIDCPVSQVIDVPEKKLGRWIACPVCKMEFAAIADEPERNDDESEDIIEREEEKPQRPSIFASRWAIPLGLLLLVGIVGVSLMRSPSMLRRTPRQRRAQRFRMRPCRLSKNPRMKIRLSPFSLSLQQGGGTDSILGIGSTIKSFLYWTTVISVVFLASSIVMLIWMAKDSRTWGMESIATWIMPILLTNILAFLVYFFSRPKGQLANCRHCNNRCLENALTCPHCRRPKPTRKNRPISDD